MVKATMPTIKAETRKTCDTEPAAGGIARTMTLARRAAIAPRGGDREEIQRTRWLSEMSRSPGRRQLFAGGALLGSWRGVEEKKSLRKACLVAISILVPLEFYIR